MLLTEMNIDFFAFLGGVEMYDLCCIFVLDAFLFPWPLVLR